MSIASETVAALVAQMLPLIKPTDKIHIVFNAQFIDWKFTPLAAAILQVIQPGYVLELHDGNTYPEHRDHPALYKLVQITELLGIEKIAQSRDGQLCRLSVMEADRKYAEHFNIICELRPDGTVCEFVDVGHSSAKIDKIIQLINAIDRDSRPDVLRQILDIACEQVIHRTTGPG
jgi:hypothetical protein